MLADAAAIQIRKDYRKLDLPEGASIKVTTSKRLSVYVSITGLPSDWVWHVVTHGRHGMPEVEMTPQAVELLAEVERIAKGPRVKTDLGDSVIYYSYHLSVMYDYKIRKPELQTA